MDVCVYLTRDHPRNVHIRVENTSMLILVIFPLTSVSTLLLRVSFGFLPFISKLQYLIVIFFAFPDFSKLQLHSLLIIDILGNTQQCAKEESCPLPSGQKLLEFDVFLSLLFLNPYLYTYLYVCLPAYLHIYYFSISHFFSICLGLTTYCDLSQLNLCA